MSALILTSSDVVNRQPPTDRSTFNVSRSLEDSGISSIARSVMPLRQCPCTGHSKILRSVGCTPSNMICCFEAFLHLSFGYRPHFPSGSQPIRRYHRTALRGPRPLSALKRHSSYPVSLGKCHCSPSPYRKFEIRAPRLSPQTMSRWIWGNTSPVRKR